MLERKPRVLKDLSKVPPKPLEIDLAYRELEEREKVKRKFGESNDDWDYRRRDAMREVRR